MTTETVQVSGRTTKPWYLKVNPIWWLMNSGEQTVEQAPWYQPTWPQWLRWLVWNIRNPLQNFRNYVIGVGDKNYKLTGRAPAMTVQRNDLVPSEYGWQWCELWGGDLWVPRLFGSVCSPGFVFYIGWQPSGIFGIKINGLLAWLVAAAAVVWFTYGRLW